MGEAKRKREAQAVAVNRRSHRREICERARRATVAFGIMVPNDNSMSITGSGVVIDRRGIIATAKHVWEKTVAEARTLQAQKPGAAARIMIPGPATYEKESENRHAVNIDYMMVEPLALTAHSKHDLALLRIAVPRNVKLVELPLDFNANPLEGDPVATCGFPYGVNMHEGRTILSSFLFGWVSAVIPHPVMPPEHRHHLLLQLPTNPGNSGGAIFDPDTGCVIGIVSRRYEPKGIPAGLAIAEPIHPAKPVLEQAVKELRMQKVVAR